MSMYHTKADEQRLLESVLLDRAALCLAAFADWDGMIEIGRCVAVDDQGSIERTDDGTDESEWRGEPFWSVYLHQAAGGVACVGDFRNQLEATAFAAGLIAMREWQQQVKA
jgi:hypothetical protein